MLSISIQIIPASIFKILSENVGLINAKLRSLPTRLEKDKLKDFAQLDQRYEIAAATNRIAAFSKGLLAMDTTFVGIIELKPRDLLEDGIRKELVKRICGALHQYLQFGTARKPGAASPEEFRGQLLQLGSILEGIRGNLEYIQVPSISLTQLLAVPPVNRSQLARNGRDAVLWLLRIT